MKNVQGLRRLRARLHRVDWANGGLAWHEYDAILEPRAQRYHDCERCLTAQLVALPWRAAQRRPRAARRCPC